MTWDRKKANKLWKKLLNRIVTVWNQGKKRKKNQSELLHWIRKSGWKKRWNDIKKICIGMGGARKRAIWKQYWNSRTQKR